MQTEIDDGANDSAISARLYNSIVNQDQTTTISSPDNVEEIPGQGTSGPVTTGPIENNTAEYVFGDSPGEVPPGGVVIGHDIKFWPGPLQLLQTVRYNDEPRWGIDARTVGNGGNNVLPGANQTWHARPDDLIGETPRGATLTIAAQVMAEGVFDAQADAPLHGCFAFDTAHYGLTEFGSIAVADVGDRWDNTYATGGYATTANTGLLAHVLAGHANVHYVEARGINGAIGEDAPSYVVEFTDAPIQYHTGSSFGVDHDGLTCNGTGAANNGDAGPAGWVDAATGDLSVFDTATPGDSIYEGITRARVRITEPFKWTEEIEGDGNADTKGFRVFFQAKVKSDLAIQTNNQELMALASHSYGELDPVTGIPDMVAYDGAAASDDCLPIDTNHWAASGNDITTTTSWCGNRYLDDGTDSFDTADVVDWDNDSANHFLSNSPTFASGAVAVLVDAQLKLSKTNVDGLADIADNGDLVQFLLKPSVVGSNQEAFYNVRLEDDLPGNYEFVQFVQLPTTPGATCTPPPTPSGTIVCQYSEPTQGTDSGLLPDGLSGGWPTATDGSSEVIIEVRVVDAIADPDTPTVIKNEADLLADGFGPWDPNASAFVAAPVADAASVANAANSYMPLPADEGAILKAVDALNGPCLTHPTDDPIPAGWVSRCSVIGLDEDPSNLTIPDGDGNMSFTLSLNNQGNTAFTATEIIDVFPFVGDGTEPASGTVGTVGSPSTVGDGRSPVSAFGGQVGFISMSGVSLPAGATLTTWVTGDASGSVSRDPIVALANNTWCDDTVANGGTAQVGGGSCPATAFDVTATYSLIDGDLNPNETLELRLTLDTENVVEDDFWTNTFGARVPQISLPIRSNDVSIMPSKCTHSRLINNVLCVTGTGIAGRTTSAGDNVDVAVHNCGYDFGDLPDGNAINSPNYATLITTTVASGNAGPGHFIIDGLYLGSLVDGEDDGQPSVAATGDNTITGTIGAGTGVGTADDEDGIALPSVTVATTTFTNTFMAGETATISATVVNTTGGDAVVYAFIDWNGDGDFGDLNETITDTVASNAAAQPVSLSVSVPITADISQSLGARFRLSTDTDLGADSEASDGEVEDYLINVIALDYGDLPDADGVAGTNSANYNTDTTTTVGAGHVITSGLYIGALVDAETDGQSSVGATGDDGTNGIIGVGTGVGTADDEDGVTFPTFYPGTSASFDVPVVNSTGNNATLYTFIDWNGDGDFDDLNESITDAANASGSVTIDVTVPATATTTSLLGARFRLSTDNGLGADGLASDGEVEDYLIQLQPYVHLGNQVWNDLDNDGQLDANESGIDGVTVELYQDTNGDGAFTAGVDARLATSTTVAGGYYTFTNLLPSTALTDTYLVVISDTNFSGPGVLVDFQSSDGNGEPAPDPDDDEDNDDNGPPKVRACSRTNMTKPYTSSLQRLT